MDEGALGSVVRAVRDESEAGGRGKAGLGGFVVDSRKSRGVDASPEVVRRARGDWERPGGGFQGRARCMHAGARKLGAVQAVCMFLPTSWSLQLPPL